MVQFHELNVAERGKPKPVAFVCVDKFVLSVIWQKGEHWDHNLILSLTLWKSKTIRQSWLTAIHFVCSGGVTVAQHVTSLASFYLVPVSNCTENLDGQSRSLRRRKCEEPLSVHLCHAISNYYSKIDQE